MYVYVSEQEEFTDFNNEEALFWVEEGLVYGDWTSGPNGDGIFQRDGQIIPSEVSFYVCLQSKSKYLVLIGIYLLIFSNILSYSQMRHLF